MPPWNDSVYKFCYQYLQLEPAPILPPAELLKLTKVQETIYETVFTESLRHAPPLRYQLGVLKSLLTAIEKSIDDWENYAISDNLMSAMSLLLTSPLPCEVDSAQQKCYVTYMLSLIRPSSGDESEPDRGAPRPTVTLLESRSLISASGTTGLRTWEAALHLGQYLCLHDDIIRGRRVLELGAGTGYLSVLCARYLGAARVLATDGSPDVVDSLSASLSLNGLREGVDVHPMRLQWGQAFDTDAEVDVVLGADITYDGSVVPALVATLCRLLEAHPHAAVYLAATQRNRATFAVFLDECCSSGLATEDVCHDMTPQREQTGPFYSDAVEIRTCRIRRA